MGHSTATDSNDIIITSHHRVRARPPEDSLVISVTDWDNLLERVKACKPSFPFWTVAYSVAFGIGVTAALSIFPMYFTQVPLWVLVAYGGLSLCGFVGGIIAFIAERAVSRHQQSDVDRLVAELERRKASATEVGAG